MGSAALAGENLADAGTIAGEQVLDLPVSNLLDPDVERRWRSPTNSATFVWDYGASVSADLIQLLGLTFGTSSTVRLRLSTVDASGAAGNVLDTGAIADGSANLDTDYGSFVYRNATPLTFRYARFDIVDPDAAYVEAGRLAIWLLEAFTYNQAYGGSIQWIDRSTVAKSRGGQSLTWNDNRYRVLDFPLRWVTTTQRFGVVERLDRVNGRHVDVVLCLDVASTNLPRDTIMGLVSDLTPVVTADPIFAPDGQLYSKQYKIEERL